MTWIAQDKVAHVVELLVARVPVFAALAVDAKHDPVALHNALQALASQMEEWKPAKDEVLVEANVQDDRARCFLLLEQGTIDIFHGEERTITMTRGDHIGITALLSDEPPNQTLRVTSNDCLLYRLSRESFENVASQYANALTLPMLRFFAGSLRHGRPAARSLTHSRPPLLNRSPDRPLVQMCVFNTKAYDRASLFSDAMAEQYKKLRVQVKFLETRLSLETVPLAAQSQIVCTFVNDDVNTEVCEALQDLGVELITMRAAGLNNVDLKRCHELGLSVTHVPAYSPNAVAEHAVGLILALNRNIHHAYERTRQGDFSLDGRLLGFDMAGKTVGVIGTGKIGKCAARILFAFGCRVLLSDVYQDLSLVKELSGNAYTVDAKYVSLDELLSQSDVITVHSPLTPETKHMFNARTFALMKRGAMLINTSRGGLVDTTALIQALKSRQLGAAGLDVYEGEQSYFFENWSERSIQDDVLARLMTFNNVIVTAHQAFFTKEALDAIANTTLKNVQEFVLGKRLKELSHFAGDH